MAGEKARVSEEIVSIIDEEARSYKELSQRSQKEKVDAELAAYKLQVEHSIKSRIKNIKEREEKKRSRVESELRFSVQKRLRIRRQELLDEFAQDLKDKILEFRNSSKYHAYIEDCLKNLNLEKATPVVISIRKEDQALVSMEGVTFKNIDFELGGFLCEQGNVVYDYTLDSRFDSAIDYFVQESQLWI